jgi:dTDP-4-dehydrorhamnose 3,5-epimerase-like enzyme
MNRNTISNCNLITLPKISERNGNITAINSSDEIPFEIKRIFYLYDIPGGETRGAHAHKECQQFLIAVSGSFDVLIDDGGNKKKVALNRANIGIHIPAGIWASEGNFSSGAICLVLASHLYNESDYIRDYKEYVNFKP